LDDPVIVALAGVVEDASHREDNEVVFHATHPEFPSLAAVPACEWGEATSQQIT
jgi:hypothetical protein